MDPTAKQRRLSPAATAAGKQPYAKPRLAPLGDLRGLTQAASSGLMEGGMSPGNSGMRA